MPGLSAERPDVPMRPTISIPTGSIAVVRLVWGLLAILGFTLHAATADGPVGPVPESLRREFGLDAFYAKSLTVHGLPVVGSARVSDPALREAVWILDHMMGRREDLLQGLAARKVRLIVMAYNEYTTDVPEHRDLKPKIFWDRRARGLGASPQCPAVSCAEENLLAYPNDPYETENILIHEFAHALHEMALAPLDPAFDRRLRAAYDDALGRGLWQGTYAASDPGEYWAEAVQDWFDNNRENDSLHNQVNTRDELRAYDPGLAALCADVFGDGPWRYRKPAFRSAGDRAHLAGYDPAAAPRFTWREAPVTDRPLVLIQTMLGDIELELDAVKAPVTTRNFLAYVLEGLYADGRFHRTVTADNQPTNQVRIQVVQVQANPARTNAFRQPIVLERTRDTGLRHLNGTVSMARAEPDSAQDEFFICIGDQPELDWGGRRNPDGQGFAAFGQVVKGMDVVRKIHPLPAQGQTLTPPLPIQRAIRTR